MTKKMTEEKTGCNGLYFDEKTETCEVSNGFKVSIAYCKKCSCQRNKYNKTEV